MARIRTIKPEYWEDEKVGKLSVECRLFFIGLLNFADDQGVFGSHPLLLKSRVFPYDVNITVSMVSEWIGELEGAEMLIPFIYKGEKFYVIRTFSKHQMVDKRYTRFIVPPSVVRKILFSRGELLGCPTQEKEMEMEKEMEEDNINSNELINGTKPHVTSLDFKEIVDYFNTRTKGVFGVVRYPISEKRRGNIRARIREYGEDAFREVVRKAAKSAFLKGNSGKFCATFDWIIKPTNFEKILTGNYDERKTKEETSEYIIG